MVTPSTPFATQTIRHLNETVFHVLNDNIEQTRKNAVVVRRSTYCTRSATLPFGFTIIRDPLLLLQLIPLLHLLGQLLLLLLRFYSSYYYYCGGGGCC